MAIPRFTHLRLSNRALRHSAAAVILAHNHPRGNIGPGEADRWITQHIRGVLGMVEVRTPGYIMVGGNDITPFIKHAGIRATASFCFTLILVQK
ncbi:hypothetical protein KI077_004233 [Escherichia coli]|nr:hypothetical protein [Escherichia coli]